MVRAVFHDKDGLPAAQVDAPALTRQHITLSELPPWVPLFNGMPMAGGPDRSARRDGGSKLQSNFTRISLDLQPKQSRLSMDLRSCPLDLSFSHWNTDKAPSMFRSTPPTLLQHTTAVVMNARSEVQPGSPVISGACAKKPVSGRLAGLMEWLHSGTHAGGQPLLPACLPHCPSACTRQQAACSWHCSNATATSEVMRADDT
jgi:hypothetical protein